MGKEVRRVQEIESLDDINLSDKTRAYAKKVLKMPLERQILHARRLAYRRSSDKDCRQFIKELDEAGFIRHDLTPNTFNVWRLYQHLQPTVTCREFIMSNEHYETMEAVTDEEVAEIVCAVSGLSDEQSYVILKYYGLEDGKIRTFGEIAKHLGRAQNPDKIRHEAFTEIKKPWVMAKMPTLFGWENLKFPDLSFYREGANKVADPDTIIECFYWIGSTYTQLKENNIHKIGDIERFPKSYWQKKFDQARLSEIEKVMHIAGYPDFTTQKPQ